MSSKTPRILKMHINLRNWKHPLKYGFLLWAVLAAVYYLRLFFYHPQSPTSSEQISIISTTINVSSTDSHDIPLTMQCNLGRLGNQMCTYAGLYGLSVLNHRRRFVVLDCNKQQLEHIFVGPSKAESIQSDQLIKQNTWNLASYLQPQDAFIPRNTNFLGGFKYPCSYTFFDHVRKEILREFQFHEHLQQYAQGVLQQANVHHLRNVTYVGVHARRTDYNYFLKNKQGIVFDVDYFRKALPYFRDKYENVIFIGVSDDRQWCIENLSKEFGVYVPPKPPSAAHDLAVLANCNHSVMTYGTFGFWGSYLAGGEVVYIENFLKPNTYYTLYQFVPGKMFPPNWKGIAAVNTSYWLKSR